MCGDLSNPLLVLPLHSNAADLPSASPAKYAEPETPNLGNLVGAGYQAYEDSILKKLQKMGGRNTVLLDAISWRIPLVSDIPTIIFGADVTHPENGEDSSPSIAAVVASQDWPEVTKYAGLVCAQAHSQELIQDLYKTWHDPVRGTLSGGMI